MTLKLIADPHNPQAAILEALKLAGPRKTVRDLENLIDGLTAKDIYAHLFAMRRADPPTVKLEVMYHPREKDGKRRKSDPWMFMDMEPGFELFYGCFDAGYYSRSV
jgi:hypothetical protein